MRLLSFILFLTFCLGLLPSKTHAQTPAASPSAASAQPAPQAQTTEYTLPPDKSAKAKALYELRGKLRIIGTIYGFAVLLALLYLGIVARYRDWAEKATKFSFLQALIVIPLFMLTTTLLDLPLDAYEHSVSRQYGLSVQGWASWFGDVGKGFLVGAVISVILLWLMIVIIRKSPRRWWFYFWFPAYGIFVLLIYGGPWFIDPLFNKFEPLEKNNPALVRHIEELTARSGLIIPHERMFLMLASEKTNELNAYVTGFGASKRIVVWDTTIQKMSPPETLFVVGHEMGHYVLNHIIYGLLLLAIGLFIALYLIYLFSGWMLHRFGVRWHIRELGDWAVLPMVFLILSIVGFFSSPIANSISRQLEHNADVYGLEVTHGINANSQEAAAHAFQVLGEVSLVYPHPSRFVTFWYGSHPSIPDRVRFAHNYDPWSKGEQPKYVK
jgi:STE24 endopeptidase